MDNTRTSLAEAPRPLSRLHRSLSLVNALLYGIGVTIGAGIYVLVGLMAGRSGMHAPLAFVGAAILMTLSAASFAELGTRMPVSASEAVYVKAAFGKDWLSFAVGLLVVVGAIVSAATISVGSAGYLSVFLPLPSQVIVAKAVLAMGAVSCLATKQSVRIAGLMTLVEVGGLLVIIGAGLTVGAPLVERLPELWPAGDSTAWAGIAASMLTAVFAFIGFEHLVNISEEMQEPRRTLPRALFLTLGITAALYALIAWVAVVTVPPAELAASPAPLALVFERLTGAPLILMSAVAVIATLNGVVVHMIMIARVLYGLADQGALPRQLAVLSPIAKVPVVATGVGVGLILVLSLTVPMAGLADLTARCTLVIFAFVHLALIKIKASEVAPPPNVFVCPAWVPYAGLASCLAFLVADVLSR